MASLPQKNRSRPSRKPITIDLEAQTVDEPIDTDADTYASDITEDGDRAFAVEAEGGESGENDTKKPVADDRPLTPPIAPPRKNSASLMGGLVGGLLALIGGAGLQWAGVLPNFGGQTVQQPIDLVPMQSQIDGLKSEILQLAQGSADNAAVAPETQDALDSIAKISASIETLSSKIDQIESTLSTGGAGENVGLETLTNRLAALETSIETQIAALPTAGSAAGIDIAASLAPIEEELRAVGGKLNDFQQNITSRLSEFDARIAQNAEKVGQTSGSAGVAIAIAAAGLKSAIDRGGSFMSELEAYATVAQDKSVVEELRNYAASGVPTISQLSDQFPAIANQIVATGQVLAPDASIADKLIASAWSLVKIRPVGQVDGDSPGAIAARLEARLKNGDIAAALAEFETLPDLNKQAATSFADRMRARQTVDGLLAKALASAMASTTTVPQAN
ncbi:MAG: mitofilin family membrane protein [Ahrensia sp.]|nr:mitofilin family membrane protein [Ahrensia sp.]